MNPLLLMAILGTGGYLAYKAFSGPSKEAVKKTKKVKEVKKSKPIKKVKDKPIQPERKAELDALMNGQSVTPQDLSEDINFKNLPAFDPDKIYD